MGVIYLDSVEIFDLICTGFIDCPCQKFFLNIKGALCKVNIGKLHSKSLIAYITTEFFVIFWAAKKVVSKPFSENP